MTKYYTHPSSFVDQGAVIGEGTKIWHFCHIMPKTQIGKNCNIGQNVFIASEVVIGNNVKIQNNVSVYTGVILEDDVFLGPSMVFTNVINPRSHVNRRGEYMVTHVKRGVTIGANATVVCGSTLGEYSFVGAGAVVTKDFPPYALIYGNPAQIHAWVCQCGIKLPFDGKTPDERTQCAECGLQYQKSGDEVRQVGEEK